MIFLNKVAHQNKHRLIIIKQKLKISIFLFSGGINAKHVKHWERSVLVIIKHAKYSISANLDCTIIWTSWKRQRIIVTIGQRNGKKEKFRSSEYWRESISSVKWKSKLYTKVSVTQYNLQ